MIFNEEFDGIIDSSRCQRLIPGPRVYWSRIAQTNVEIFKKSRFLVFAELLIAWHCRIPRVICISISGYILRFHRFFQDFWKECFAPPPPPCGGCHKFAFLCLIPRRSAPGMTKIGASGPEDLHVISQRLARDMPKALRPTPVGPAPGTCSIWTWYRYGLPWAPQKSSLAIL